VSRSITATRPYRTSLKTLPTGDCELPQWRSLYATASVRCDCLGLAWRDARIQAIATASADQLLVVTPQLRVHGNEQSTASLLHESRSVRARTAAVNRRAAPVPRPSGHERGAGADGALVLFARVVYISRLRALRPEVRFREEHRRWSHIGQAPAHLRHGDRPGGAGLPGARGV
jgi:hypothetical protein